MCRDGGGNRLRWTDRNTRSKMMQRRARRKDAPRELCALRDRLRRAKEAQKEAASRRREFQKEHREAFREYRRLQTREWKARRRIAEIEREFGLFTHPQCPIPLYVR